MGRFGLQRIMHGLRWRFLHLKYMIWARSFSALAAVEIWLRFRMMGQAPPHALPGELIVSLTSYPPRFATLLPTLHCLLAQSVKPDRVILWVGADALEFLPQPVRDLQAKGLEIRACKDVGPYTKIIPALREFPKAFIVTADDDLFYYRYWLADLIVDWDGSARQIVCHRAHRIKFGDDGLPIPYHEWDFDIQGPALSTTIFPTGVGGVLYPPGCFAQDVLDEEKFLSLSPKADDVWLFWMGRLAGAIYRKTPAASGTSCG